MKLYSERFWSRFCTQEALENLFAAVELWELIDLNLTTDIFLRQSKPVPVKILVQVGWRSVPLCHSGQENGQGYQQQLTRLFPLGWKAIYISRCLSPLCITISLPSKRIGHQQLATVITIFQHLI